MRRRSGAERVSRVRYVANRGDLHHVKEHAEPFWESTATRKQDLEISWLDLGNGHLSPDLDTVNKILLEEIER